MDFTGLDSPLRAARPDLRLDTVAAPAEELAKRVVAILDQAGQALSGSERPTFVDGSLYKSYVIPKKRIEGDLCQCP